MRFIVMFVTVVCIMCYSPFHRASVHVRKLSETHSTDIVRGIYVSAVLPSNKFLPGHVTPWTYLSATSQKLIGLYRAGKKLTGTTQTNVGVTSHDQVQ